MLARTLLAVHAHPDDETITMGGTLARYSAAGVRTVVVTCTTGSLGDVRGLAPADKIASLREHELDQAIRCLGVSRSVQLRYADSGMPGWPTNHAPGAFFAAPLTEAAVRLIEVIHQERPQVMVAYDHTGGYPHPDHVKAHDVAIAAFAASGQARPAKLYFVRFPITWSRAFVAGLCAAGIDAPASAVSGADAGPEVLEIGVPDNTVTTEIDVRAHIATKRQALACHTSQMPPEHFLMRMPDELAHELWATERYSREVGPTSTLPGAIEADLFAGLD